MNQHKNFNSGEEHEHITQNQAAQNSVQEFPSVEALLRHDAAQTAAPASIEQRLRKSSADFPQPSRPWWKRLFQ
jgi:hypothetical protein